MKVLVMCLGDLSSNPRANRIIRLLSGKGYSVDALSHLFFGDLPVVKLFAIPLASQRCTSKIWRILLGAMTSLLLRVNKYPKGLAIWVNDHRHQIQNFEKQIGGKIYDLIVVEDLQLLPLAFRISKSGKVLFDAREFYTRQNEESLKFNLFEYPFRNFICREFLNKCDYLVTVSPGLADAYRADFGVDMDIVRSTPNYREMPVIRTRQGQIRMVHHGIANTNRGLHNMINVVRRLDSRFTLDLYLVGNDRKIAMLKQVAEGCDRVCFRTPVRFDKIVSMLNHYDVGFYYLEPKGFNVTFNLPNKFFEFIQARLAVAIGPSPNMAELINQYSCGFVADEFSIDAMVQTLQVLTPEQIDQAKYNSALAAKELCYEKESMKLLKLIN